MTPWLGVAAVAAIVQFFFGYSGLFTFYTVEGFPPEEATDNWAGWIATPHTSVLVLLSTVFVLGRCGWPRASARHCRPARSGASSRSSASWRTRILYRILDSPWVTAGTGGGDQTHTATAVTVGWAAYASRSPLAPRGCRAAPTGVRRPLRGSAQAAR